MNYSQDGEKITLAMTSDEYEQLLLMLGVAIGAASSDARIFYAWLAFVNRLNAGNAHFTPYEIPDPYREGIQ